MDQRMEDILMLGRFGRETDRARDVIALSLKCADELGDHVFDSCHLLSGLFCEGEGVASRVLNSFDVTQHQIDTALQTRKRVAASAFRIDDDVRTVLDTAFYAADQMHHMYIGTEHLLIGAAANGVKSAELLNDWGFSSRAVQSEVLSILGYGPA